MSSSQFLTGSREKKLSSSGKLGGKEGKFAQASGEDDNNREKARKVYCPQDY